MRSKKQNQKYHAKRRFGERLGIKFTQYLNDMFLHKIHSNQMRLVQKQANRVMVYEVTFTPRQQDMLGGEAKEMTVHIVYDRMRKTIVTVAEPGTIFDSMVDNSSNQADYPIGQMKTEEA